MILLEKFSRLVNAPYLDPKMINCCNSICSKDLKLRTVKEANMYIKMTSMVFSKKNNFFLDFYNERGQEVQENYVNTFSEKNLYWGHWAI